MTITGTLNRWARLHAPGGTATVTRVAPTDAPARYVVEIVTSCDTVPSFMSCATWRAALDLAARAISGGSHTWE